MWNCIWIPERSKTNLKSDRNTIFAPKHVIYQTFSAKSWQIGNDRPQLRKQLKTHANCLWDAMWIQIGSQNRPNDSYHYHNTFYFANVFKQNGPESGTNRKRIVERGPSPRKTLGKRYWMLICIPKASRKCKNKRWYFYENTCYEIHKHIFQALRANQICP